jgi:hypothetical protein
MSTFGGATGGSFGVGSGAGALRIDLCTQSREQYFDRWFFGWNIRPHGLYAHLMFASRGVFPPTRRWQLDEHASEQYFATRCPGRNVLPQSGLAQT